MSLLNKKSKGFRIICGVLAFLLVQNSLEQVHAQPTPFLLPGHNYFVDLSVPYSLPVLRGMRVYPNKPFKFDFVVGSGDRHTIGQKEASLLIKYFLTCLTIPEEDLWVNLSPYESGRIIPNELSLTDAGNSLLEQDKFLKQLASSLTYPESRLGKLFWEKVYQKAYEKYGTTNLPVSTYNKVWIVPNKAVVYDMGNSALIGETHLKVLLEEDYLALKRHSSHPLAGEGNRLHEISAAITREIILPELEKEINEGRNFAPVRQIFHSMILAAWFKQALKRNVLSDFYVNKKKISGIDGVDRNAKEKIYREYLRIYKVGAYNYIREDVDPISQQVIPRKYFSGGLFFGNLNTAMRTLQVPDFAAIAPLLDKARITDLTDAVAQVTLSPIGGGNWDQILNNQAMMSDLAQRVLSKKTLTKLASILAFVVMTAITVSAPPAKAAQITANPDGKTVQVVVGKEDARLGMGGIFRQIGYTQGSLWGPDGVVQVVGNKLDPKPRDLSRILVGQIFNVPLPTVVSVASAPVVESPVARPASAVAAPPPLVINLPQMRRVAAKPEPGRSPRLVRAAPAEPLPEPLPVVRETKLIPVKLTNDTLRLAGMGNATQTEKSMESPTPFSEMMKGSKGVVRLDPNNKPLVGEHKKGELLFEIILDPQQVEPIRELEARLRTLEKELAKRKGTSANNLALLKDIAPLEDQIAQVKSQLAEKRESGVISQVFAPTDLTIMPGDVYVQDGTPVEGNQNLARFFPSHTVVFKLERPMSFNYNAITAFSVDGQPIQSIRQIKVGMAPDGRELQLEMVVNTQQPITANIPVPLQIDFDPYKDYDLRLDQVHTGASSLTTVNRPPGKISIPATVVGTTRYLVQPGQSVVYGEPVAVMSNPELENKYNAKLMVVRSLKMQLLQANHPGGGNNLTGDERVRLEADLTAATQDLDTLQKQFNSMVIVAPQDGIVTSIRYDKPNSFQEGESLMTMTPSAVTIGDINKGTLLVSNDTPAPEGSPVLVVASDGYAAAGIVQKVSSRILNSSIELKNTKAIEVMVPNPDGRFFNKEFVYVQFPKTPEDAEKLLAIIKDQNSNLSPTAAGTPPPPDWGVKWPPLPNPIYVASKGSVAVPVAHVGNNSGIGFNELNTLLSANELTGGELFIEYIKTQAAEGFPRASSLDANVGFYMENGRLKVGGGIVGSVLGAVGAGLQTGNAYAAGIPIFAEIFANIFNELSGEKNMEVKRAKELTEMALNKFRLDVLEQQRKAISTWSQLGEIEQDIAQKEWELAQGAQGLEITTAREKIKEDKTVNRIDADNQFNGLKNELTELRRQRAVLIAELEKYIGRKIDSRQRFTVHIEEGDYPSLGDVNALQQRMEANNFSLKLAGAESRADQLTLDIQGLSFWPGFNIGATSSSEKPVNPPVNLFSSIPNSGITQGTMPYGTVSLPILSGRRNILGRIAEADVKKAALVEAGARADVTTRFTQAAEDVDSYSVLIKGQEGIVDGIRAGIISLAQYPDEQTKNILMERNRELTEAVFKLNLYERKYIEAMAVLRSLEAIGPEPSIFPAGGASSVTTVAYHTSSRIYRVNAPPIIPLTHAAVSFDRFQPKGPSQRPGEIIYPDGNEGMQIFIEQAAVVPGIGPHGIRYTYAGGNATATDASGGEAAPAAHVSPLFRLDILKKILINEENDLQRAVALETLLTKYADDPGFSDSVYEIFTLTTHPDVILGLSQYEKELKSPDMDKMTQLISGAQAAHNQLAVDMGYQILGDIIRTNPEVLKQWTANVFTVDERGINQATTQTVVLLNFLLHPGNSIAKQLLLQSTDFWNTDDKARIYDYLGSDESDDVTTLKQGFYKAVFINAATVDAESSLKPGSFENPSFMGFVLTSNLLAKDRILRTQRDNLRFLATSPLVELDTDHDLKISPDQWKLYIPNFWQKAKDSTDATFAQSKGFYGRTPFQRFSQAPVAETEVEYFKRLGADQRKAIVEKADVPLLDRLVLADTLSRSDILKRLNETPEGRLARLEAYSNPKIDENLRRSIELSNWNDLRTDIPAVHDPVSNRIYRTGLLMLYKATNRPEFLLYGLLTFSNPLELAQSGSPWGKEMIGEQMNRITTPSAIRVLRDMSEYGWWTRFWEGGHRTLSGKANKELGIIQEKIGYLDPGAVDKYIASRLRDADPEIRGMLKDLLSLRERIKLEVYENNQDIPWIPSIFYWSLAWMAGVIASLWGITKLWPTIKYRNETREERLIRLLPNVLGPESVSTFRGRINGNGKRQSDKALLVTGYPLGADNLTIGIFLSWQNLISKWDTDQGPLAPERIIDDLSQILNNASKIRRIMAFDTELVRKKAGIITRYKIESVDLDWEKVSRKLIEKGWASEEFTDAKEEILLTTLLSQQVKEEMFTAFGKDDYLKLYPLLEEIVHAKTVDGERYFKTIGFFWALSVDTLNVLNKVLPQQGFDGSQYKRLQKYVRAFKRYRTSSYTYLSLMDKGANVDDVLGYKKSDKNAWERFGVFLSIRKLQKFQYVLENESGDYFPELQSLTTDENILNPGVYKDTKKLLEETRRLMNEAIKGPYKLQALGSTERRRASTDRRLTSRVFPILLLLAPAVVGGILQFLGFGILTSGMSFLGILGFLLSVWVVRSANSKVMKTPSKVAINKIADEITLELDEKIRKLGKNQASEKYETNDQEIIALAREEGIEKTIQQQKSKSIDRVVIVNESENSIPETEGLIPHWRQEELITDKVPVNVLASSTLGSGNAYDEIILKVRAMYDSDEDFLKAHIVFIFNGHEVSADPTFLEWALVEGNRMAQDEAGKGGHIILYARDAYFGPVPKFPETGIRLLTSRANRRELPFYSWINTTFSRTGDPNIQGIFESVDIDELNERDTTRDERSKILQSMRDQGYDMSNNELKQFIVLSGPILLAPDGVKLMLNMARGDPTWGARSKRIRRHMFRDKFILLEKFFRLKGDALSNDLDDYIDRRMEFDDLKGLIRDEARERGVAINVIEAEIRQQLEFNYEEMHEIFERSNINFKLSAYVPPPNEEVLFHVLGNGSGEREMGRFRDALSKTGGMGLSPIVVQEDAALVSTNRIFNRPALSLPSLAEHSTGKPPGGIDLNFQPQFIRRYSRTNPGTIQQAAFADMPDGFKGFNFNIVRFTSNLTANGAIQLMFNSN